MKYFFLFGVALMLWSCAALPKIQPLTDISSPCPSPFLAEKTRLIHTVEVRVAGSTKAVLIGVTLVDPDRRAMSAAVLSPEGMALLEASFGPEGLALDRALPPFDSEDFARNMMDDMRLIFLAPGGTPVQKGLLPDGSAVCRWSCAAGGWVDVIRTKDENFRMVRYRPGGRIGRVVTLSGKKDAPYAHIGLAGSGTLEYSLNMMLLESESLKDDRPVSDKVEKIRP